MSDLIEEEFDGFLGLLILNKDNHMPIEEMFDSQFWGDRYRATLSCDRFDFTLQCQVIVIHD